MPETTPASVTFTARLPEGEITVTLKSTAPVVRDVIKVALDVQGAQWKAGAL